MHHRRIATLLLAASLVPVAACSDDTDEPASGSSTSSSTAGLGTDGTATAAGTVEVEVFLVDQERFNVGEAPYVKAVSRAVPSGDPVQGAVDALFEGPTTDEANESLVLVASGATGATVESVTDGVAVVQLVGACASGGSTLTIADQLIPTLSQFDEVEAVKILDPDGQTSDPDGPGDSFPLCLEP
jgi:Fe-S cluster biogenesis protein NfuA